MILYRGINPELHKNNAGELRPKDALPFARSPEYGRAEWGNAYWGECEANAVVEHQQHQAGYSTSGVSTTPHLLRAIVYATHAGKYPYGYVYVIDEALCKIHEVTIYKVTDYVPSPSIPEDEEVILVARDFGIIPNELVIEIRKVEKLP